MIKRRATSKKRVKAAAAWIVALFMVLSVIPAPVVRAEGAVVYLDGENGSDENSGTDVENAVGSLYQAVDLLGGSGTIIVTGTLKISGEREWYMDSDIVLRADDSLEGPMIRITEEGSLLLGNITISGQDVLIKNSGSLDLDEGVVLKVWDEKVSAPEGIITTDTGITRKYGEVIDGTGVETGGENWTEEGFSETTWDDSTQGSETEESWSESAGTDSEQSQSSTEDSQGSSEDSQKESSANSGSGSGEGWFEVPDDEAASEAESTEKTESESVQPESQTDGSTAQKTDTETDKETAAGTDKETGTETDALAEQLKPSELFMKRIKELQVSSREDVVQVLEISKIFDYMSDEEKEKVSQDAIESLWSAQSISDGLNKTDMGVSVVGNLPWFVQLRAELLDPAQAPAGEDGKAILAPYELSLWNLYDDIPYYIPEGEQVTVMMPVPQSEEAQEPVIYHYREDGSYETIVPRLENGMLVFETSSFSPFSIAGSTVITGIGINGQTAEGPGRGDVETNKGNSSKDKNNNQTSGGQTGGTPSGQGNGGNSTGGTSTPGSSSTEASGSGQQSAAPSPSAAPSAQGSTGTVQGNTNAPRTADDTDMGTYGFMSAGAALVIAGIFLVLRKKRETV